MTTEGADEKARDGEVLGTDNEREENRRRRILVNGIVAVVIPYDYKGIRSSSVCCILPAAARARREVTRARRNYSALHVEERIAMSQEQGVEGA